MIKTDEEIDKIIEDYNELRGAVFPISLGIQKKSYDIGKEIAEKFSKDFPEFPKGLGFLGMLTHPEILFSEYCMDIYYANTKIQNFNKKYEIIDDILELDITRISLTGLDYAFSEVWRKHIGV